MIIDEFIKNGKIYLIIEIHDGFYLDVYKTSHISFYGENKQSLLIQESDLHQELIPLFEIEIDNLYLRYDETCDGHNKEILIYDVQNSESLWTAWEKLGNVCNKLDEVKQGIENFRNLIYYDCLEKRYNKRDKNKK